jgi:hypothetical protein
MSKYNLNEGNESLKKILLLMKYDNKKTLTENVEELEEDNFTDNLSGFAGGAAAGAIAGSFIPVVGTVIGGAIGGLLGLLNSSGNAYSQISGAITQYCTPEKSGKPKMSDSELNAIADEIFDAIDGWGTEEEDIRSALSGLETFPDFCAMAKKYQRRQGESLLDALDGDIDIDSDWRKFVWIPIVDIIERTEETLPPEEQKDGDEVLVPTPEDGEGKKGGKSKYKKCTGTYKLYCYNKEVIGKVQKALGIVDDGAFGPKTQKALEEAGFKNGFTDADVDKIVKGNDDGKEESNIKVKSDPVDDEEIKDVETITTDNDTITRPDANSGEF